MARTPCQFIDPATGFAYAWPINHSEESEVNVANALQYSAVMAGGGLVRQQGDPSAVTISLSGTIMHRTQHQNFIYWSLLSRQQTIYWRDQDTAQYEVQITSYKPKRERVTHNPMDPGMPLHIIRWSMDMDVFRVMWGDLLGVTDY